MTPSLYRMLLGMLLWSYATVAFAGPLKVLTFNTWLLRPLPGLDFSRDTDLRASLMPSYLASTGADVIALQEVWDGRLRRRLINAMATHGYGFSLYSPNRYDDGVTPPFLRGAFGDGLLILSRYPLEVPQDWRLHFDGFTRPDEWFVRKGALHAVVYPPGTEAVHVYTSHLGAVDFNPALSIYDPSQESTRDAQIAQLIAWMRATAPSGPRVLAIDANVNTFSWSHKMRHWVRLLARGYLRLVADPALLLMDAYLAATGRGLDDEFTAPTYTSSALNTYVREDSHFAGAPDSRIDFVLTGESVTPVAAQVVFNRPVKLTPALRERFEPSTNQVFLSDHFGVLVDLAVPEMRR